MSSRQQRRAAARAAASRAEINRQNAQHSTGPRTAKGKANSSQNSFKHGLYSRQLCTSSEEAVELDALKADLRAEHQPGNQTEELLVNEMAEQYWRIKRGRRLETQILDGSASIPQLAAAQRMMSSAERGFHKALATLHQLQVARGFVPQNEPEACFVIQVPDVANETSVPSVTTTLAVTNVLPPTSNGETNLDNGGDRPRRAAPGSGEPL